MTEKNMPRLVVQLPEEIEHQIYSQIVALSRQAVAEVTKSVANNKRYVNQAELCDMFKCGIPVINEWRAMGLKSFPKGKSIYFDMNDVDRFIEEKLKF
ncbi:hypothetical protein [Jeotgalibaca porci]|uniref:hypothetical protein n=1 Tax=Jeotgalibaca porci TaxID=1868793 RepID=UPI0035A0FFB3